VQFWLKKHDLGEYVPQFERANISGRTILRGISDGDLERMGVISKFRRRFIIKELEELLREK
jgi:hypothetical protein